MMRQRGLTLVELMVSIVLMLIITLAAVSLFSTFSGSYKTADNTQGMQDDARFTMGIIAQALRNAGYQGRMGPVTTTDMTDTVFGPASPDPDRWRVQGANAMTITTISGLTFSGSGVVNSSDALISRFFGSNLADPNNPLVTQWTGSVPVADGTMIDCSGRAIPYPTAPGDLGVSAFFVGVPSGSTEPELECASYNPTTSVYSVTQLARGVEVFQVAYGVDTDGDGVPNQWLSANSAWSTVANSPNWNNVVAVRVGMVMRGDVGSAQTTNTVTLYPLGDSFTSEAAWTFVAPSDGRIRKVFNATFLLRNPIQ